MDNVKNDKYYISKILTDTKYLISLAEKYTDEDLEKNETVLDSIFFH